MNSFRPRVLVALLAATAAFSLLFRFFDAPSSPDQPATPPVSWAFAPAQSANAAAVATSPPTESVRAQTLTRLTYAQAWTGPLPEPMAAFRTWTDRYLAAPSPAARLALTAEGRALAHARRPAMRRLIVTDPARALAVTVPAVVRTALPAAVLAELETRHAGRGDYALQASQPAPGEPRTEPALRRTVYLAGVTYTARPYGRREAQLTKEDASLHGIALDGQFALHESPLRVLEPGEAPIALAEPAARCFGCLLPAEPTLPSAAEVNTTDLAWVSFDGATRRIHPADLDTLERRTLRAEDRPGPRVAPVTAGDLPAPPATPGEANAPTTAPDAPTSHNTGTKQVLVIRTDFSDFPGEPLTQSAAQAVLDTAVGPFLETASYGLTNLVTTVTSQLYRLPRTGSSYALADDRNGIHSDARAAASAHYTLSNFDRIIVLFPNIGTSRVTGSKITFAGLANVVGTNAWINGPTAFVLATVSHELGHTYGLLHANLWRAKNADAVSPDGTTLEYGDPFDMMGSTSATGITRDARHHFNMRSKNLLGWLPDTAVTTVSRSGTYRIYRFDSRASPRDQPLALRIFRDGVRWYWVGLRQNFLPAGNPRTNGAYVIWGYNQRLQSQLLDLTTPGISANDAALTFGTTFTDAPYGVSIKPLATGGTEPEQWMDVEITLPPGAVPPNVVTSWGRLGSTYFDTETGDDISPNPETNVPMDLRGIVALAAGDQHAIGLKADGTVVAWGNHLDGQIAVPPSLANVVALAAGGSISGVVKRDGTVQLWGASTNGVTTPPADLTGVRQLAIGGSKSIGIYHALALKTDGSIVAWGDNTRGQTTIPAGLTNVVAIAASDRLSIALRADGSVVRWGTTFTGAIPFPTGLADVTAIASSGGAGHALALKKDGTVVAWGANSSGQATVPAGLTNVVAIATGGFHSLALQADGTVHAWGLATSAATSVPPALPRSFAIAGSSAGSFALTGSAFQITEQPVAQSAAQGGNAFFSVKALGVLPTYQWQKNGMAIPGATASSLALGRITPADAGTYSVVITSGGVTLRSAGVALTVSSAPTAATLGRLINLSVLTSLSKPDDSFSLGYVVGGAGTSGSKPLLIRAAGPSLAALGVESVLGDPRFELFAGSTKTGENDQWGGTPAIVGITAAVGAFPFTGPTSRDAAVLAEIRTRDNSVLVRGIGTGAVIAELYDATAVNDFTLTSPRLINVSVLKNLGSHLTVGFVLGGTAPTRVLIRVLGPTLGAFGVAGTIADPRLALFNSSSVQQAENNDWNGTPELIRAFESVGAFALALTSKDAALVATLPPGAYTVQASGVGGSTGVALVEVYEVP